MKPKSTALFALLGLLAAGLLPSCTAYVDRGPVTTGAATTTTTASDPWTGTTTRRTTTTTY